MSDPLQFVVFRAGSQRFAIEIHSVSEVINLREITPLPGAPSFVPGMIDLRGKLLPVIDLRKRFGNADIHDAMQTRILIARARNQEVGLIVDEADQVYTISTENIQPPPEHASEYVLAVAREKDSLFLILDLEALLSGLRAITSGSKRLAHA